ncbi:MAG TPA: BON domain-containing protein [Terracidiphilus sp.]|nr:BON domain-containing protein [Terracidiphilus sp.]
MQSLRFSNRRISVSPSNRNRALRRGWLATGAAALLTLSLIAGCKSNNQPAAPTDQQLTSSIQSKIQGESPLNGQNIQVSVSNGIATLSGTVPDDASRALAGNDSGSVAGVKTVVNNLVVQPAQQAAPAPAAQPAQEHKQDYSHRDRQERASNRRRQETQAPPPQRQAYNAPPVQQYPPPQPMQQSAPASPPQPVVQHVTLPAGTAIPVILTEALDTKTAQPNDVFHATLASDIMSDGIVAIPRGAHILGQVVDSKEAAHFKGQAFISLDLTQISAYGRKIDLQTDTFSQQGKARGKNTAEKTGGGAALGAIIGALAGGGKGAAIGAIAGGGAGAGVNAVTRGQEVQIPSESRLEFHLQAPITFTVTPQSQRAPVNPDPSLQQR